MKKIIFFISLNILISNVYCQVDCPNPIEENYRKVMSSSFSKDFKKCPVIIIAKYLKDGYIKNYRKPSKLKEMVFFQCVNMDDKFKFDPITNETVGDFFVIDKKLSEPLFNIKQNDKLKLTGTTFTQNYFGTEINTFFIVTKIEIIP